MVKEDAGREPGRRGPGRALRVDAQRSIEAITNALIDAAARGERPNMASLASAAGVSRVTLYSHFPTIDAAVEAAVERAINEARLATDRLDLAAGDTMNALADLIDAHWESLARFRNLYAVATDLLTQDRLRALHDPLFGPVTDAIARGQETGDIRSDLPRTWLVASLYALMHQAADEVSAGRLSRDEAGGVITKSVQAMFADRTPH